MTAFPWLAGLVACAVAAVAAYGITRLVQWFARRLAEAEWLDTEPQPNDTSETGGPQ